MAINLLKPIALYRSDIINYTPIPITKRRRFVTRYKMNVCITVELVLYKAGNSLQGVGVVNKILYVSLECMVAV